MNKSLEALMVAQCQMLVTKECHPKWWGSTDEESLQIVTKERKRLEKKCRKAGK